MASKFVDDDDVPQQRIRFSDVETQPCRKLLPIQGYAKMPLVSLEKSVEPLVSIVENVEKMVAWAKWKCAEIPADNLTVDQSSSIILYSMEWDSPEKSFYFILNSTLRDENRAKLRPWFSYLKLFITALSSLSPSNYIVFRGIKVDMRSAYKTGQTIIWWGFSSCTRTIDVLENDQFLGSSGARTFFTIECSSGRDIREHSAVPCENEILLPAARQFEVIGCLSQGKDLFMVHLKETKSPVRLIEMLPEVSDSHFMKITNISISICV